MNRGWVTGVFLTVLTVATGCTSVVRDPVGVAQGQQPNAAAPVPLASVAADLGPRSPEKGYWPRTVQLGQTSDLGQVVLDGQGFTLYRFDKDSADPPSTTCVDDCTTRWPPVLASDSIKFQGLDPAKLGVINRADGTRQVTVGGHALYRFTGDQVPGQANGQGTDGDWFAASPTGDKAAP